MQTGRQAVDNLLRKNGADFVPLYDSPWGGTIEKWVDQGMPTDENGNAVSSAEHFGFDMTGCGGWINTEAKPDASEVVEETDEWKIVRNGSGGLHKWWKNKAGTPEHIDFHMSSRKIWEEEYREHLLTNHRARLRDLDEARATFEKCKKGNRWMHYGGTFIWEPLRASLGDVNMFMALVDDPDWIHDFNRVYTDMNKACYKILFDEVGVPDGVWIYEDLGYRDRLFCSPQHMRDLFFPYFTELVAFFHSYDLPVVLHSCGYQEPIIPFIIEAGFDGLNPMEVKAGNDIFKYAEQYADQICFVGGLDARVLESGDRPLIKREVSNLIEGMKARGAKYIYGSDHSLSTNIDYQDFLYSLEVYREHR